MSPYFVKTKGSPRTFPAIVLELRTNTAQQVRHAEIFKEEHFQRPPIFPANTHDMTFGFVGVRCDDQLSE